MLNQVLSCDACPQLTVVRLCVERFEEGLLCSDHGTFNLQQFRFEEDAVHAAGFQRHGVGCCLEGVSLVAVLLGEQACFEGPCFAALPIEGQAALVRLQGEFVFALGLQQLSVVKPVSRTAGILFKRL